MKMRRTMLYVPGNNPAMLQNAGIYGADSLLLDLEDAVSVTEKDSARYLVANMMKIIDFGRSEVVVRINPLDTDFGRDDLEIIVPLKPTGGLRVPKTSCAKDIKLLDEVLSEIEEKNGMEVGSTKVMAMLETALGVSRAYEVATASERVTAITFGAEDFTADMGIRRSTEGKELFTPRSEIAIAAKAAGVDAIDTVFSDVNNEEGLRQETELIKSLGFAGKACINPRQIQPIHDVFTPSDKDIEYAKRVIAAIEEAKAKGSGVIALNGRMIDKPVAMRAEKIIAYAAAVGKA